MIEKTLLAVRSAAPFLFMNDLNVKTVVLSQFMTVFRIREETDLTQKKADTPFGPFLPFEWRNNMETEGNRRIRGRRSVKYRKLAESLEEENRQIRQRILEEKKERIRQEEAYYQSIHRLIDQLESESVGTAREDVPIEEEDADYPEEKQLIEQETAKSSNKPNPNHIVLAAVIMIVLIGAFFLFDGLFRNQEPVAQDDTPAEETVRHMDPKLRSLWLSNRDLNEDYVGQIVFDSGLIDLPFVQARNVYKEDGSLYAFYDKEGNLVEDPAGYTGNDVYIWTNWKSGEYDRYEEGGSVFMDFRNSIDDQNIIIYGHHFARDWDPSRSKQFTPLDALLSEENYESNRTLKLILDNQIREYYVANVFTIDIGNDYECQITRTDMNRDLSGNQDPGFFVEFIRYMNRISRYDTGESLTDDDRILTLITCLEHQPQFRQVIVCKEVSAAVYQ